MSPWCVPHHDSGKVFIQRGILYSSPEQSAANLMRIRYVHQHCDKKKAPISQTNRLKKAIAVDTENKDVYDKSSSRYNIPEPRRWSSQALCYSHTWASLNILQLMLTDSEGVAVRSVEGHREAGLRLWQDFMVQVTNWTIKKKKASDYWHVFIFPARGRPFFTDVMM